VPLEGFYKGGGLYQNYCDDPSERSLHYGLTMRANGGEFAAGVFRRFISRQVLGLGLRFLVEPNGVLRREPCLDRDGGEGQVNLGAALNFCQAWGRRWGRAFIFRCGGPRADLRKRRRRSRRK